MFNEHELFHHGVKGMKWGIRKDRKRSSNNRPKQGLGSFRETREMLRNKPRKKKSTVNRLKDKSRVGKRWLMNNSILNMQLQQASQFAMDQSIQAATRASLQSLSLAVSGGRNPFMFG